jgi:general L-amino acid transport system substrate-binding protein
MTHKEEETVKHKSLSVALSLLILLSLVLAACNGTPAASTECPPCPEAGECPPCPEAGECPPCPTAAPAAAAAPGRILEAVRSRGRVVCGVHTSLPGFGYLDADGRNVGFDIDVCRAVAVAMFDDPEAVEFVAIQAADRGPALQNAEVDMVSRNMTWTTTRETQWGNFTQVMFYDGQGMMVRADSGFTTLEDLDGATVCVTTGTTTELNLADAFRQRGLEFTAVTFEDTSAVYGAYQDGRCDAATSDKSQLAAVRSGFTNPDEHTIMDVTMSKEPLTPAVPAGDEQWFDIVKMVLWALIYAEELGINSENVDQMTSSDNTEVLRFMGLEGTFGQTDLGLDIDFAANVIRTMGNYGEIYDRYMGPNGLSFTLDRGLNNLWTEGGLLYAIPLR